MKTNSSIRCFFILVLSLIGWSLSNPIQSHAQTAPISKPSPIKPSAPPVRVNPVSSQQEVAKQQVSITLPELITLVLQGNRTLRNQTLQRLVQRQELRAAEQKFDPRITPALSAGIAQSLSSASVSGDLDTPFGVSGGVTGRSRQTTLIRGAAVGASLLTPAGTNLGLIVDPLSDGQPLSFRVSQPLMRGSGTAVNQASINQARLTNSQDQLLLQEQVINIITTSTTRYTALIQAQQAVRIQEMALERRRRQLEILQALVKAGRRAPVELFDTERAIADAERDLIVAQNLLAQANTNILNLIGTDRSLQFIASGETVQKLFQTALQQMQRYDLERLIQTAYQIRPDYLRAQFDIDIQKLNRLVAKDNLRWQLDVQVNGNLGDFSQGTVGLVATRTFPEPLLETDRVQSEVGVQQAENSLAQVRETIRNDVTTRLGDVRSNLARVQAARQATENAQRQLEADRVRFSRGIGGVSIFQVISQEQNLVDAQNAQLQAEIAFLNSSAELDQTVGITLESWKAQIESSRVLKEDGLGKDRLTPVKN
ncbi:TolC family protein [Cyanobacteria bacterium FACHB-63]|nr:TolC family protein [Cyanobacteria bacterium FACHB-63]